MDSLIVDEEELVAAFLRGHPDVGPLIDPLNNPPGGGASTSLVGKFPAIRVTRISGAPGHPWEDSPVVQVECWADTREVAKNLGRAAAAAMGDIVGTYPQGRVGGHDFSGSFLPFQDEDTHRFKFQFDVRLLTYTADEFDSRD